MLKDKSGKIVLFFYISVAILFAAVAINKFLPSESQKEIKQEIPPVKQANIFGIFTDNLIETKNKVERNETLSEILENFTLSNLTVSEIASNSRDVFDVRKIRPGKTYYTYASNDSLNDLKYFVYEIDPVNYVVMDISDSLNVYKGEREVEVVQTSRAASINNSLYLTLMENETSPELAVKLSQIFAWQIDFYRIQKGDNFKVIFEEKYVDDKFVGIGEIIGAQFVHSDEKFFAIPFEQDSIRQFFDEKGNSLRKAFLKAPLEFSRISSRYNKKRFHPVLKRTRAHLGTDYAAPYGTPIRSVGDGVVIAAGYSRGNGNYVKVKHNSTYTTQYLHMSKFAKGIRNGRRVSQGDIIGYVGSTGLATGPHLCYRFWKNGVQVDPFKEKIPPSHPVKKELLEVYDSVKTEVMNQLSQIKFLEDSELNSAEINLSSIR